MSAAENTAGRTATVNPATHPELYEARPTEFVGGADATLIYVGVESRADFDKIALPLQDNGPNESGHVLVKIKGTYGRRTPTIIFQHWLISPTIEGYRALAAIKSGGQS